MAEYNRWMNGKLYAVCAEIPDEKRKADLGAFFKSIHGTLNHLLWGDRIWLRRFGVHSYPVTPIGDDIYTDFRELCADREKTDELILQWTQGLREEWLAEPFEFTSLTDGKTRRAPAWVFVAQLFNHQTHHRGQVTTLIKQLGYEPGITDIPWLPGAVEIL
ncbi:MAG: DinB family protein, partial [Acidiferrobacterales bacterium]